jgi:hypothetical protein
MESMRNHLKKLFGISALCGSLSLGSMPLAAQGAHGAESPQALIERVKNSAQAGDVSELLACVAPDDRAELVVMMVAGVAMMTAFMQMGGEMMGGMAEGMAEALDEDGMTDEQRAEMETAQAEAAAEAARMENRLSEILKKHGVEQLIEEDGEGFDPEAGGQKSARELLAGVDDIALFQDLMGFLSEMGEEGPQVDDLPIPENVMEFSDLSVDGDRATVRSGDETIEMVRVDGRWYMKLPDMTGSDDDE